MTDIAALTKANANRWGAMHVQTRVEPEIDSVAKRLVAPSAKAVYQRISGQTNVPWWVIAVIHEREASQNWGANIAQGDPWNRVSQHVPAGRGPFSSFDAAAYDALENCAPHAAHWRDWSIGGSLTILEEYNGLGYANKGRPSPYIWAGTDQYVSGKYVADGVYDPNAVDHQLGCAALLARMEALDSTIDLGAPVPVVKSPKAPPPPEPKPLPTKPAGGAVAGGAGAAAAAHQAGLPLRDVLIIGISVFAVIITAVILTKLKQ